MNEQSPTEPTFDAREYLLSMPQEQTAQPKNDGFDPREWLFAVGEPENDCARIEQALTQAGFLDPHVVVAEEATFAFRVRVEDDPQTYDPANVHQRLIPALEAVGFRPWLVRIANQLGPDRLVEGDFRVE